MRYILLANLASTLFMTGLIWLVQLVHYPLFSKVGGASFIDYHAGHGQLIIWIVLPMMALQLVTSALLVLRRPSWLDGFVAWAGLVLVGTVWLSTVFLQVPQHGNLAAGFDASAHQVLVTSNWLRTFAWTAHGAILLVAVDRLLRSHAT